jgi:hypothetical protein
MNKLKAKNPQSLFEPPDELAAKTALQQMNAPYCGLGFRKERLDDELYKLLIDQFRRVAPAFRIEGDVFEISNVDDKAIQALYHEETEFNLQMSKLLQPMHEAWSGMKLTESACYGFRVYQRGTYLHKHVDVTATHIISSTICVDHHLASPWPLYIEDIEGNGHLVNLEPGEFVFYEGAKLIHGRPYPLEGDYYAGMFVHYRPLGPVENRVLAS